MTKSLFGRLMITYLLIIAVMVMALAVYLPSRMANYFVEAKKNQLTSKGNEFLPLASSFLTGREDYATTVRILAAVEQLLDSQVWIVDPSGQIVATSPAGGLLLRGSRLEPSELAPVLQGQVVSSQGTVTRQGQVVISVGIPVTARANGPVIGALYFHAPLANIQTTIAVVRRMILFTALVAMVIAMLLALGFSQSLSRPLGLMSKAALAMAQGDFSIRVKSPHGRDEIGQLADSFNFLTSSLQETLDSLQTEKGRMENLLTSLTEGVVATDDEGQIILFNPAATRLLNLPRAPVMASLPETSQLPSELATLLTSEHLDETATRTLCVSGDMILALTVSPVFDAQKEVTGKVAILQDVTEAHRLEQLRRDFVANVSHELRTPLTSIQGFLEGILDETIPMSAAPRYLNIIHQETLRLSRLIHDLLDLSHIESGKHHLERQAITLNSMIEMLTWQARKATHQDSVHVDLDLEADDPCVDADPDRIGQVILNLVTNAFKFTPSGGIVTVTSRVENDKLRVQVRDSGRGILPQDLPNIWDRFYKSDRSRSQESGFGLGLAIVKTLIEAHGETITAANASDGGAVFTFSLPLSR